ncbi:hypothetical protein, partial [Serratia nevei]
SAILWKPPAHSPEENMVRQKCSGIRRSYLARPLTASKKSYQVRINRSKYRTWGMENSALTD